MKHLFNIFIIAVSAFMAVSCLDRDLRDLDTYEGTEISTIQSVYHRYYLDETIPVSGEKKVAQKALKVSGIKIDKEAGTISFSAAIPEGFPADQVSAVDASKLVVAVTISTAAVIAPLDGAPKLGVVGDWSKPNRYRVTSGSGTTQDWTITLNLFN